MKFGLSLDSVVDEAPTSDTVDRFIELMTAAEARGFASVWIGETYPSAVTRMMMLPAAPLVLASLIRGTKMRLGTGVLLLPAHEPLALAYEIAVLDHLSGGRVTLGVGVGRPDLARHFRLDPTTIGAYADEVLALLRALWSGADGFTGSFVAVDRGIRPLPLQPGGPPILVAGYVKRSAERAGEQDGYYAGTPCSQPLLATQVSRYRATLARLGKDASAGQVAVNRLVLVAPTEREAILDAHRYLAPIMKIYAGQNSFRGDTRPMTGTATEVFDRLHVDYCLVGTPAQVAERVRRYADLGVTDLQLRLAPHGMPHELSLRTIELFGGEVMPRIAAADAVPGGRHHQPLS